MFDFDENIFFPHHNPAGHFPPEKPRYTMSEELMHTEREMRETIARLIKFEERLQTKFDDMLKHITSDNVIFKNTFAESHRLFLESVKNEINVFEGNVDSSLTLFKETISSDYAHLSEEVKSQITTYYNEYVEKLNGYKEELNSIYDNFRNAVESRLEQYNEISVQAHNDFVTSMNTRFTEVERALNADYETFVNQTTTAINEFKTTWTESINSRLDGQDSEIADAVAYMKTNFNASIENLLFTMKEDGSLVGIITTEIFTTPIMFGAVPDGETDCSDAFTNAFKKASRVYVPRGKYRIEKRIEIPANCELVLEGEILSVNGKEASAFSSKNYAVLHLVDQGTMFLHNGSKLLGGLIYSESYTDGAVQLDIREEAMQNVEITTAMIGAFEEGSCAIYIDAFNGTNGSLCHSRFASSIRGFEWAYYFNRPQNASTPWVTFCEMSGILAQNRKAFTHNITNIAHAFGSTRWNFTLCGGGSVWQYDEGEAVMDCVGDHGIYNVLLSDIGEDFAQKIALDFEKAHHSTVHGLEFGSPLIVNKQGKYLYFTNGNVGTVETENGVLHYAINGGVLTGCYVGNIPNGGFVLSDLPFSNKFTLNVPYMDNYGVRVRTEQGWNKLTFINDTASAVEGISLQFTSFLM